MCDFRRGDLFVLSWSRVRRVCRGSVSSVMFMGGGSEYCCEVRIYVSSAVECGLFLSLGVCCILCVINVLSDL